MSPPVEQALERLATLLYDINRAADQGEWDSLPAITAEFNETARALTTQPFGRLGGAAERAKLRDLITLHEQTISRCQARQKEIAPLVSALRPTRTL